MAQIFVPSVKKDLQKLFTGAVEINIRTGYLTFGAWSEIFEKVSQKARIRLIVGMLCENQGGKNIPVDLSDPQKTFNRLIESGKFERASREVLEDIADRIHRKKLEIRGHSDIHGAMYMGRKRFRRFRAFAGSVNFTWPPLMNGQGNIWFDVRLAKTNRNLAKQFENDWGYCTDVSSLILEGVKERFPDWKPSKPSLIKRMLRWLFRKREM